MLGSIAMAIIYGLKVNLSVAMVAMLNHTAISSHGSGALHSPESEQNATSEPVCSMGNSTEKVEVSYD